MRREILILFFITPLVLLYVFSHQIKKFANPHRLPLTIQDSFKELLGSETEDWNYIQSEQDVKDLAFYTQVYEQNKRYQFHNDPVLRIPKTIHLIWIGPKPFPRNSIQYMRSWIAYHPDWTFNFWTDRKRIPPCSGMKVRQLKDFSFAFLGDKFNLSQNWGEKADILRYEILYQEGGLYIDHDVKCFRSFHNLHTAYDFYTGLEMPHEEIDDLAITAGISVIGAKPKHPILRGAIQVVLNRWDSVTKKFSSNDSFTQARRVSHRTLIALTHSLKNNLITSGERDIVFPACYFYPKYDLPAFYARHFYATAWHGLYETSSQQLLLDLLKLIRRRDAKIVRVEIISLGALMGLFILYCYMVRPVKMSKKD